MRKALEGSKHMGWLYTDRVSPQRQKVLLAAPDFDTIANHIIQEMRIISFDICRGERGDVKGCRRGYRGQYHRSPEDGERGNAKLISLMSNRLIYYANGRTTKHSMNADKLRRSLKAGSAKIWMNERGLRAQQKSINLVVELEVEPWLTIAKEYVANPSKYPDPNKEIKALDGVKAPTGIILEVKGAFFDEDAKEHIPEDKKDRSRQIHSYGFT